MIFVATGVHEHGFNRLVQAVDGLAGKKLLGDVFIQTGFSSYVPQHCRWSKALDFNAYERMIAEASIVISHGGAGSIAAALESRKPTIVVPRLKRFNEHNNDHQLELAGELKKQGRVLVVYEIDTLYATIQKAYTFKPALAAGKSSIPRLLHGFLDECARGRRCRRLKPLREGTGI